MLPIKSEARLKTLLIEPSSERLTRRPECPLPTLRLTLPYVAALVPPDVEVAIAYDAVEDIEDDYLEMFDLVGVTCTGHTGQIRRSLEFGERLKRVSVTSVIGGPVTIQDGGRFLPILSRYFDAVLVGEAESSFVALLHDLRHETVKRVYQGENFVRLEALPVPRFDLIDLDLFKAPYIFPAMTARGCPRKCDFCSEFLYSPWRFRPVDQVVTELKVYQSRFGVERVVFRDDDFLVHLRRSREMLTKMLPLGLQWTCQTDLNLARHPDVAKLAIAAGMRSVCFGLESVRAENRNDIGKTFFTLEETNGLLRMLNEQGVETQINIIFGHDGDTPDIFDQTVEFLLENKVSHFYANIVFPEAGTTLYKRLQQEGRLIDSHTGNGPSPLPRMFLETEDPAQLNYVPKNFTAEELVTGAQYARARFLAERSPDAIFWLGPDRIEY